MKKYFSVSNILTLFFLLILIINQAPILINNLSHSGIIFKATEYIVISPQIEAQRRLFPIVKSNSMVIVWATWCAPCKLEMNRFKASVDNGKISTGKIFAINPFEDRSTINTFLSNSPYPFIFIEAPLISEKLKIQATPTTLFFKGETLSRISSGMSLVGIWRAEFFLK